MSELLHKVICKFINDPSIPYSDREKVSMKVLPYVELLEKQGKQKPANRGEVQSLTVERAKEVSPFMRNGFENESVKWSEEDEDVIGMAIIALENMYDPDEPNKTYAGYTMPFNKAALRLRYLKDRGLPKNEWSEEDKKMIIKICQNLYDYPRIKSPFDDESFNEAQKEVQFIKSLRPQNNITDEELAQAKKDAYNDALDKIEYHSGEPTFDDGWSAAIWFLKKRNTVPQSQWKPSKEQISVLEQWLKNKQYDGDSRYAYPFFQSLYEQLKQL